MLMLTSFTLPPYASVMLLMLLKDNSHWFYGHFPVEPGLTGCSCHVPFAFISNLCILWDRLKLFTFSLTVSRQI